MRKVAGTGNCMSQKMQWLFRMMWLHKPINTLLAPMSSWESFLFLLFPRRHLSTALKFSRAHLKRLSKSKDLFLLAHSCYTFNPCQLIGLKKKKREMGQLHCVCVNAAKVCRTWLFQSCVDRVINLIWCFLKRHAVELRNLFFSFNCHIKSNLVLSTEDADIFFNASSAGQQTIPEFYADSWWFGWTGSCCCDSGAPISRGMPSTNEWMSEWMKEWMNKSVTRRFNRLPVSAWAFFSSSVALMSWMSQ